MALRITSKDYENLYVTSYKRKIVLKNIGRLLESYAREKKHSTRENSLIFTREILTSTQEKKSFCAREKVRVPKKICAKVGEKNKFPPRKKLKK